MVLPASEGFALDRAGAIALVVRRLALAAGASVIGRAQTETFPDIGFQGIGAVAPLLYGLGVIAALRRIGPAIVEVHQQPRLARVIAALLPTSRVMLVLHNDPLAMRGLLTVRARAGTLASLHWVVCVSTYLRDRYAVGVADTRRLTVVANPLTLADLPDPATVRRHEILFVGRIVEGKGIADFIASCATAMPSLAGWSARIIGGDRFGPDSPETSYVIAMRNSARRAGIGFAGYQGHQAVLDAMAAAAIVVVPSRWPEPFGLTALEAMASGAAVIAARSGGLPEVVGDAAMLVPPGDVDALTDAIRALATDDAARSRIVRAGLARAARFDTRLIDAELQALRDAQS